MSLTHLSGHSSVIDGDNKYGSFSMVTSQRCFFYYYYFYYSITIFICFYTFLSFDLCKVVQRTFGVLLMLSYTLSSWKPGSPTLTHFVFFPSFYSSSSSKRKYSVRACVRVHIDSHTHTHRTEFHLILIACVKSSRPWQTCPRANRQFLRLYKWDFMSVCLRADDLGHQRVV